MERTKNTDKNHLKKASFGFCEKVIAEQTRSGFPNFK
jgi:hypothetical protein